MRFTSILSLVLFITITLLSLSLMNCGAAFDPKPRVTVEKFGKTVSTDLRTQNNHSWLKQKAPGKFYKTYDYKYTGQGRIDSEDYKNEHPNDLLVLEYFPDDGDYLITIYSQDPIPDEKFFKK